MDNCTSGVSEEKAADIYEGWTFCRVPGAGSLRRSSHSALARLPGASWAAVFPFSSLLPSQCFPRVRTVCFALGFRLACLEFISLNSEHMQGSFDVVSALSQLTQQSWGQWNIPLGGRGIEREVALSEGPFSPATGLPP